MADVEIYRQLKKDLESAGITSGTLYIPKLSMLQNVTNINNFAAAFRKGYEVKPVIEPSEFNERVGVKFNKLEQGAQKTK